MDTASQVDTGVDTNTATDTVVETPTETVDTTWSDWIFGDYASSTDSDSIIDSDSDFEICEAVTVEFEQILARAVILLDKSGSMGTSNVGGVSLWELATNAVEDIVTGYENDISFGFDTFPRDNSSAIYEQILMDVAPLNADPILAEMSTLSANGGTPLLESIKQYVSQYTYYSLATDTDSDTTLDTDTNTDTGVDPNQCPFACSSICDTITGLPVGGTCNGIGEQCCDLRPQYSLPENAVWRKYAPIFMDGTGQSYLIVISDGEDYSATPEILGEFARIMLQQYGIRSIAIGFGAGASEEQLNAIAANGGTPFTTFLDAADGAELTTALNSIAQVVAVSCDFDLGSFDEDVVDYDKVIVTFDGEMVPRNDSDCAGNQGWSWRDASRTAIHLCDFACSDLQKQNVENLEIEIACHEGDVIVE